MKTLRTLIRLDAALLAFFGYLMTTYTHSMTIRRPWGVFHFEQEQAPLIFLGTTVVVLAVVLFVVSDFALIGHRRKLGTLLAAGNLAVAVTIIAAKPSDWSNFIGRYPAIVLLIMAAALAWASWRRLRPDDTAAELAALQIPDDIREALLRQIGETAAQEERNRLARDLHDSIKQQIFTINVSTAAAQELWERDPEKARGALADVRRSAREAMVEMQALLHQLTPRALTSAGLVEAIREQCEALGYRTEAEVKLELGEPIPDDQLPPGAQETLFRIAQEALSNVARHARARTVRVRLGQEEDWAVLRVRDDGQGFAPGTQASGMGLRNLKERAESLRGILKLHSAPGQGTALTVRLPLNAPPEVTRVEKAALKEDQNLVSFGSLALIFLMSRSEDKSFQDMTYESLFILGLLLMAGLWTWTRTRSLLGASPEAVSRLRFAVHRNRALSFFLAGWWAPWYWRIEEGWTNGRYAWLAMAGVCLLFSFLDMVDFHRASRFSNPFRSSSPAWYRVFFFTLIGMIVLGALFGAFWLIFLWLMDPKDAQIMIQSLERTFRPIPIKILFLVTTTMIFLYTLTRQPRTEGVPS